ncbi:putative xanthine dehydrogenase molybdenum-binding subunit XdhA [subsurface metagenome]
MLNKIPNIKFDGKSVYTNLPIGGAYRGYGASQGYFGYGQIVDMIAADTHIDPVDFYKKYAISRGETSPIFKALGEGREGVEMKLQSVGLDKCLEKGAAAFNWREKREQYWFYGEKNKNSRFKRGVGMVSLMQGSAIARVDMASAYMKMNDDGAFNLNIGATDLGTGSDTVLAQIAAEVLDVPLEKIIVYSSDTDFTPFDKGAYASSTTYLSGEAVRKCALKVKKQILKAASYILESPEDRLICRSGKVCVEDSGQSVTYSDICVYTLYQDNQFQIQATASHVPDQSPPPFAANFAEIEVDTETGMIKVLNYLAAVDCGTPINPALAEGQCEGAVVNGISYALIENYVFSAKGRLINGSFGRYKIFTAKDVGDIKIILVDGEYEDTGPFGAKSIAEININGPMPAIANAFYHATGKRLYRAPFTPEAVLAILKE